jgi:hypothetical protein
VPRFYFFLTILTLWGAIMGGHPAGVSAQNTPFPTSLAPETQADYTFGQSMAFSLAITNSPKLTAGNLFISTPQFTNTYSVAFDLNANEGERLSLQHTLDLAQVRIQPFTTVTYWWSVQDEAGQLYEVARQTFGYDDDQFQWKFNEQANIQIYWIADGLDLGQVALDVVLESLPGIQSVIQAELPKPLRIYLYPSGNDLRAALRLTGQEWVAGHASPELGVIMLAAENPRTAVVDLRRRLPHEISHLLLYRATQTNYTNLPKWFDEGLATTFETVPNPNYEPALQTALANNTLFPFAQLCERFPDQTNEQIYQAYAQSWSFVSYLQTTHGDKALQEMINAFNDGADCETAVQRAIGLSLEEATEQWLAEIQPEGNTAVFNQNLIWLVILFGGFALTVLLLVAPRKK